jgi:hypothetical protein
VAIDPNIIMQAGKGVTPIRRQDPMREALGIQSLKSGQQRQNHLRKQEERADRKEASDVASAETKAEANRKYRRMQKIVANNGQGWDAVQREAAAEGTQLPDYTDEVGQKTLGHFRSMGMSAAENQAVADRGLTREGQESARAATADHRARIAGQGDERNRIAEIRARRTGLGTAGGNESYSARSTLYRNGTAVMYSNRGGRKVVGPNGEEYTGAEAARIVEAGRASGVDDTGERSFARAEGTGRQKALSESAGTFEAVRKNITNLQKVVSAIDEGAVTGPIANWFPDLRSSSIKLSNLQKTLALDVVGAVTFGALSQGELDLANDVALPKGLKPPELRKWVQARIAAQSKVANYLQQQIRHINDGGTVATWVAQMEEIQQMDGGGSEPVQGVTEDDIRETMRANNMTRDQVMERLNGR